MREVFVSVADLFGFDSSRIPDDLGYTFTEMPARD
jgi:hypothetical protein